VPLPSIRPVTFKHPIRDPAGILCTKPETNVESAILTALPTQLNIATI
jgi:hypothetical protein